MRRYAAAIRAFLCTAFSVLLVTGPACENVLVGAAPSYRRVHVKVVVDPSYAVSALWHRNVETLFSNVNRIYRSWFEIDFVIDTMFVMDINDENVCGDLWEWDCLRSRVDRGTSDLVVHFSKETQQDDNHLGIGLFDHGYLQVRQMARHRVSEPFKYAFVTLLHELGHIFGGVHVFNDRTDVVTIMEPSLRRQTLYKAGKYMEFSSLEFDDMNAALIFDLSRRPFRPEEMDTAFWTRVKRVYTKRIAACCPSGLKEAAKHKPEIGCFYNSYAPYLFLAGWASACGRHREAVAYIDSALEVASVVKERYTDRHTEGFAHRWDTAFEGEMAYQKAIYLLNSGDFTRADSLYTEYEKTLEFFTATVRQKNKASFMWHRNRAMRRGEGRQKKTGEKGKILPPL